MWDPTQPSRGPPLPQPGGQGLQGARVPPASRSHQWAEAYQRQACLFVLTMAADGLLTPAVRGRPGVSDARLKVHGQSAA